MTRKTATNRHKSSKPAALGRSLARGLREAVAYERGKLKGRVEVYNVPPAVDVRGIREKIGLSQADFASRYGFNRRSLQDWEQGRRIPDSAARAYLLVIAPNPRAVDEAPFREAS
ncbi:MAG: helix-turn-helix domain-containing protein [Bryobacteraceae bacterium]|jgi:putative transcriptional regulator